ncbi:MAG: peptidylprolyl isomerase [Fibrobacterota bacterium]
MIMEKLRSGKFVKWVMIIVVVTFVGTILFAWGMDLDGSSFGKTAVGVIDGKKIPFNTFNEDLNNRLRSERQDTSVSSYRLAMMREELFQQLVAQAILEKEIRNLKLAASSEELIRYFHKNPPPGLTNNPYFMTDSLFDTTKYFKFLDSPEAYGIPGMVYLEEYASKFTIPTSQLQTLISSAVKVTDIEAKDRLQTQEEKADIEYLFVSAENVPAAGPVVTDAEIQAYYSANPDSFKTEGMAEFEYAVLPKQASAEDDSLVKKEIVELHKRVLSGESFEALAFEHSEDASAKDSGSLGEFGKGMMVRPFEEAAFALKPGEISAPVRTMFGYHIIKLTARNDKEAKIKARHILLKVAPSVATVDLLKERADTLGERVKAGASLADLAKREGLAYSKTGPVQKGAPVPGFEGESRYLPGLDHLGFGNAEKAEDVLENDNGVYLFHLVKYYGAGTAPLSVMRDNIVARLSLNKKKAEARKKLETVLTEIKAGASLKALSEKDNALGYMQQNSATRVAYLPHLGASSIAIYKAFALNEGECTPVMDLPAGCAVIQMIKKYPVVISDTDPRIASTRRELMDQGRYLIYGDWFEQKKSGIKVESNLSTFYNQ